MDARVALSTGLVPDVSATATAERLLAAGSPAVELSGGAPSATIERDVVSLAKRADVRLHNYFPPPAVPFVLNLASETPEVVAKSVAHVERALDLTEQIGGQFYSLHAGFLIDPAVDQLGRPIDPQQIADRAHGMARFLVEVENLAERAKRQGVTLLLENNVLSAENYATFGRNPLLMVDPAELVEIMERTPDNVGVLLDVAHLKVSARTLGLDPVEMFTAAEPWVRGYHLSDNDGTADTNGPIHADSWFWPYLDAAVPYWSIEVRGLSASDYVQQATLTQDKMS